MSASNRRRATVAVIGSGLLVGGFVYLGRFVPAPPLSSWRSASEWYERVGPSTAIVAGLRVLGVILASWVLLASLLHLASTLPHPGASVARVRALAAATGPRSLDRFVHSVAGASFAAGLAIGPPAATMEPPWEAGTATLRLVSEGQEAQEAQEPSETADAPATVVSVSGDSLWSLAERALSEHSLPDSGRATADDAAITAYWVQLIELNRDVLVVRDNPDLIYAGQTFSLPPVAPRSL